MVLADPPQARPAPRVLAAAVAAVLAGGLGAAQPLALVGLAALAVVVTGLVITPRVALPSVALGVYALVPLGDLPLPETVNTASPSLLVLLVWLYRFWRDQGEVPRDREGRLLLALCALVVGLLLTTALSGAYLKTGLGWTVAFTGNVLLVAMALRLEVPAARERLIATWVGLSGALGGYAVIEVLVLRGNPFAALVSAVGGEPVEQTWAVYRATTTLGHPLENAAFFVLGATLALAIAVRTGSRRYGAAGVLAIAGLAATGSRGPSAALLVGALWVLAAQVGKVPRIRIVALGGAIALALTGALVVQLARSGSAEAESSSHYRAQTVGTGLQAVGENPVLGVGAGASAVAKEDEGGSLASLSYENGWLEAAISAGVPFFVLLVVLFGSALVTAWRRAHVEAGAALAVAVLVMANSNVLEGSRQGLLRLGLLLGLAWVPIAAPKRGAGYIRE